MNVKVYPMRDLPESEAEAWREVQTRRETFSGPHFSPDIYKVVSNFYKNIFVAVSSKPKAFLPFQSLGFGRGCGVPLIDYEALITADDDVDARCLLKKASMNQWYFRHLIGAEAWNEAFQKDVAYRVNTQNKEAYRRKLNEKNITMQNLDRKKRNLERKLGALKFRSHCNDPSLLQIILNWQSIRYNGGRPFHPLLHKTLSYLLTQNNKRLQPVLSALYGGNHLVAAHFGLVCGSVHHWWFPAYNPEFSSYSPGKILCHSIIDGLSSLDCDILDFGPGKQNYKIEFSNMEWPFMTGSIETESLMTTIRQFRRKLNRLFS